MVVPVPLVILVGSTMVCSIVVEGFVNSRKTDWVQLFTNLIFISVSAIFGACYICYKDSFARVSKDVDSWWVYNYLSEETVILKKKAEDWMDWYGFYY